MSKRSLVLPGLYLIIFAVLFLIPGNSNIKASSSDSVNRPTEVGMASLPTTEKTHATKPEATTGGLANTFQAKSGGVSYGSAVQASASVAAATPAYDYVNIGGGNVPIFISGDTQIDSGYQVALYNGRLLYGHNIAGVFATLPGLGVGSTVTISLGGNTGTYRVANVMTMEKPMVQRYMPALANARMSGVQYDFALMTCAGTMRGGGDASHRTIVFVVRV
jgi:hypothetical protein